MSDDKKTWEKNEVLLLISDWEMLPELWDVKNKLYRNRIQKQNALKELAAKYNTNINEVSRKMHNLRTQLHSEIRKAKSKKSGDAVKSSWEFFNALKFILSDQTNLSTPECMINKCEPQYEIMELNDNSLEYNDTLQAHQTVQTKRREIETEPPDNDQPLKKLAPAYLMNKPADEFQIFGDYVASELRSLRYAKNQRSLKLEIQKAIIRASEMDLADFPTPQTSNSLLRVTKSDGIL